MRLVLEGQVPSWIYCLYDWENFPRREWGDLKPGRFKRQRAVDEIRHHIHRQAPRRRPTSLSSSCSRTARRR